MSELSLELQEKTLDQTSELSLELVRFELRASIHMPCLERYKLRLRLYSVLLWPMHLP